MDAQQIITTTQGVISAVTTALTPAAKASYQVALVGAKMQALAGLTGLAPDLIGVFFGIVLVIISLIGFFWVVKNWDKLHEVDDGNMAVFPLIGLVIGLLLLGIAGSDLLSNGIFYYIMYNHPDAYLSYQIMQKITAAS